MKKLIISLYVLLVALNIVAMEEDPKTQMQNNVEDFARIALAIEPALNGGIIRDIPEDLHYLHNADLYQAIMAGDIEDADLYQAIMAGDIEGTNELINKIKAESQNWIFPLISIISVLNYKVTTGVIDSDKALEIIKLFLEAGINQEQLDNAVTKAMISGNYKLSGLLMNYGAVPDLEPYATSLALLAPE